MSAFCAWTKLHSTLVGSLARNPYKRHMIVGCPVAGCHQIATYPDEWCWSLTQIMEQERSNL
jgi:hypothetical protein